MGARAGAPAEELDGGLRLKRFSSGAVQASFPDDAVGAAWRGDGLLSLLFGVFISSYLLWPLVIAAVLAAVWSPIVKVAVCVFCAAYAVTFFDGAELKTGRTSDTLRTSSCWRMSWRYLRLRLVRTVQLVPEQSVIYAISPHGILLLSRIAWYADVWEHLFPGKPSAFRVLAASPMFKVPLVRDLCLALSAVDASKRSAQAVLRRGLSMAVYPGGSREIFMADPSAPDRIYNSGRKGFIRLALESGTPIVPVYVFGEKYLYRRIMPSERLRSFALKWFRMPLLLFFGRWGTLLPLRGNMMIVVGAPIPTPLVEKPTEQQVDELHAAYQRALRDLFMTWRGEAGYGNEELIME